MLGGSSQRLAHHPLQKDRDTITALRKRMLQDLQLGGLGGRTQEAYLRAVKQVAGHFQTPTDRLSEQQVREYFLQLKNDLFSCALTRSRLVRGTRRHRVRLRLRSSAARQTRRTIPSPPRLQAPGTRVTPLPKSVRARQSPRAPMSMPSVSHIQAYGLAPPGFLNTDWRSGFADSNPSWLGGLQPSEEGLELFLKHR
jgi:Phage integrase, N-terminal SAM-like domain